jgi:hypothetical protein
MVSPEVGRNAECGHFLRGKPQPVQGEDKEGEEWVERVPGWCEKQQALQDAAADGADAADGPAAADGADAADGPAAAAKARLNGSTRRRTVESQEEVRYLTSSVCVPPFHKPAPRLPPRCMPHCAGQQVP